METLHLLELPLILYLQTLGNWLILVARSFTLLGNEEFYFIVMPALFWCIDFQFGINVGIMLILSNNINSLFKLAFHSPRPYWISSKLKAPIYESSFGLPSGHAQNAVSLWGLLTTKVSKRYYPFLILIILLIGFSRILLGVHFISDVLLGWFIGGLLLILFMKVEKPIKSWVVIQSPIKLHIFSILFSLILIGLPLLFITMLHNWTIPTAWIHNAVQSNPESLVTPLSLSGIISLAGVWLGMSNGLVLLFKNHGEFDITGTLPTKILRYLIGLTGIVVIWYGLGKVLPRTDDLLGYSLRYIRYGLTGLWIAYIAPVFFARLNLAGFKTNNNIFSKNYGG